MYVCAHAVIWVWIIQCVLQVIFVISLYTRLRNDERSRLRRCAWVDSDQKDAHQCRSAEKRVTQCGILLVLTVLLHDCRSLLLSGDCPDRLASLPRCLRKQVSYKTWVKPAAKAHPPPHIKTRSKEHIISVAGRVVHVGCSVWLMQSSIPSCSLSLWRWKEQLCQVCFSLTLNHKFCTMYIPK